MLAVTGILVQSFVRFPGFPPFPVSNPARPLAVLKGLLSTEGNNVVLFLLGVGVVELTIGKQVCESTRALFSLAGTNRSSSCYGGTYSAVQQQQCRRSCVSEVSSLVYENTPCIVLVPTYLWVCPFISHGTAVGRKTGHLLVI